MKNEEIKEEWYIPINDFINYFKEESFLKGPELLNDNDKLKKENQQLKNVIEEYGRLNKENGRGFKITSIKQYNIDELIRYKDNWNKLKSFLKNTRNEHLEWDKKHNCEWKGYNAYSELLIKIQELERGVDDEQR